ncbi:MAG: Do family serine endopeptidase [Parachlamydiaceae bacterium]|nr:Do family serine endopeptidase [Parachlamydiaceae bacterium]
MISNIKKQIVIIAIASSLPCFNTFAAEALMTQALERPVSFTQVAKKAIPAVVSIRVQETKKQSARGEKSKTNPWGNSDSEDDESSTADFWHRFFSIPFGGKEAEKSSVGQASGFIVSPDGHIITNNHVVQDSDEIIVTFNDGEEFLGKVIGQDNNTDIALIKIEGTDLPFLKFGNSDTLEVAQWIMAIGTPFGLKASVTVGVVSAKGRNNLDLARIEDFIQTDTAINSGNSGGPLLDLNGDIIGVNTAIASTMGGSMGIGFAVPSNIAKNVMEQLMSKGSISRSFIGVELQQIDQNLATAFGLHKPEGVLIAQVVPNSPAGKAGIKEGDIIVKYNDLTVTSIGGLRTSIALMIPGSTVKLSILRQGKPLDITLETAEYMGNVSSIEEKMIQENVLGITVANMTTDLAQKLGYREEKGVLITNVGVGSLGQLAGLRKGALIMAINQKKTESVEQFKKLLSDADKTKPILLLVKEGNSVRFISIKM